MRFSEPLTIAGFEINPGQTCDFGLKISETYLGIPVRIPVKVYRAQKPGPTVFLAGALHGDEIVGTGIIREFMINPPELLKGTLICLPVVNFFGFETHTRYLPDRRDLNRCFPGEENGNMAERLAHILMQEIVSKCDYGMDLHCAAMRRTNFAQVRADVSIPELKDLAQAFGCEIVLDKKGDDGTLRAVATNRGCLTLLYEAGEVLKFEPEVIQVGVQGVQNVLRALSMLKGKVVAPKYQIIVKSTHWIRASSGGLLQFHVKPGDVLTKDQAVATCKGIFSIDETIITAPSPGIVLGMTTMPAVKPGEPICHIAQIPES